MIGVFRDLNTNLRRIFPERQLFYRVKGEVEFVTLTAQIQFGVFTFVLALGGWIAFTSFHYLAFDWMLEAQRQDAKQAWAAYLRTDAEREQTTAKNEDLNKNLRSLELSLAVVQVSQERIMSRVTTRTATRIDRVRRIVDMTGVGIDRFIKPVEEPTETLAESTQNTAVSASLSGQGGPFVAMAATMASDDTEPAAPMAKQDTLNVKVAALDARMVEWDKIEKLMESLPLAPPIDSYRLTSTFGPRKDPVNKRWAKHYGLDMANRRGEPVFSPAAGEVVFAGRNGRYGWLLEIDHGFGLRTRYGHLKKILVKKGEQVGFRQEIAKLGSSGRSTGPHLHYEIMVDGKPVDPAKFLTAGKYVFKLAARDQ